jgi:HEAT repeat protein
MRGLFVGGGLWLAMTAAAMGQVNRATPGIDWPMDEDPRLVVPDSPLVLDVRTVPLWIESLASADADERMRAAMALGKATQMKLRGPEAGVEELQAALDHRDGNVAARRAVASALVTMNVRAAAPKLLKHAQGSDVELVRIADRGLAQWDYEPARAMWIARLGDSQATLSMRVSAVRALGQVRDKAAEATLIAVAVNRAQDAGLRLEAARAAARVASAAAVTGARQLMAAAPASGEQGKPSSESSLHRLLAAELLADAGGLPGAEALLGELAIDRDSAVAHAAIVALVRARSASAATVAIKLAEHRDALVREQSVVALWQAMGEPGVAVIGARLSDPIPSVRRLAVPAMVDMIAHASTGTAARATVRSALSGENAIGVEEAAMVCGQAAALGLTTEPATSTKLVSLLSHASPRVRFAVTWALRRIGDETARAALLERGKALLGQPVNPDTDRELAQIIQAWGQWKQAGSEQVIRPLVAKNAKRTIEVRSAAVWSLGLLKEGAPDNALANELWSRINDNKGDNPESPDLQVLAVVTLGRMGHKPSAATMEKTLAKSTANTAMEVAMRWSVTRITGKAQQEPVPQSIVDRGWFLEAMEKGP